MEQFFKHPQTLSRLREGPLGPYLDAFTQQIIYHPQSGWFEDTPLKGGTEQGYPLKGV